MSFKPSGHLEKYGWKKGCGIGKGEDGIKEAIKVKLKFDTSGVGHNMGEQFTYHWWEKAYNDASQTVDVKEDQNGIQMKTTGSSVLSTKKTSKSLSGKSLLYGAFVKAATLSDGMERREVDSSSDSDSSDSQKLGSVVSDEDLFRICGGRTAHKGARHGLRGSGKLARIALQDAGQGHQKDDSLNTRIAVGHVDVEANGDRSKRPRKTKKKSKKKSRDLDEFEERPCHSKTQQGPECTVKEERPGQMELKSGMEGLNNGRDSVLVQEESFNKRRDKKKRKRRREVEEERNRVKQDIKGRTDLHGVTKRKKKHKHTL